MPRLPPSLLRRAYNISPHLATLLPACRDLSSARNELRWIREHVLQLTPQTGSSSSSPSPSEKLERERLVAKLCARRGRRSVPLQYVLGSQPFGPLDVRCRPGVLIPRPETEAWTCRLADLLLARSAEAGGLPLRIVDFCSGSGCVALLLFALLRRRVPRLSVRGFDVEPRAVALARENLARNVRRGAMRAVGKGKEEEEQSIEFHRADVFSTDWLPLMSGGNEKGEEEEEEKTVDVLVANPPYISARGFDRDTGRSVRNYEPKLALVPGAELSRRWGDCKPEDVFYARLLEIASPAVLRRPPRIVVFEVGDLAQAVRVVERALVGGGGGRGGGGSAAAVWDTVEIWRDWPDMLPAEDEARVVNVAGRSVLIRGSGEGRAVVLCRDKAQ